MPLVHRNLSAADILDQLTIGVVAFWYIFCTVGDAVCMHSVPIANRQLCSPSVCLFCTSSVETN